MAPLDVGILGATGMVGQQFVAQLQAHPTFRLTWLGGSERSRGRAYEEASTWRLPVPLDPALSRRIVEPPVPGTAPRLVFSALDANVAGELEDAFARAGHLVVSNTRNHRLDPDVPLLVPEINPDHLALLRGQAAKGWTGGIVTNPNCSTVFLSMALAALRGFGLRRVVVTTLQAASGAGYPGVASLDLLGNVIPFIAGEEEKIEVETRKILGTLVGGRVEPHPVIISANTTRVPVVNGHTEMISVEFDAPVPLGELRAAFERFEGRPQELGLPSAPRPAFVYLEAVNRPQPRLDVDRAGGMAVTIGRLRLCPVLHAKFVALGHNTIRGAAGAAVLNAELMVAEGLI